MRGRRGSQGRRAECWHVLVSVPLFFSPPLIVACEARSGWLLRVIGGVVITPHHTSQNLGPRGGRSVIMRRRVLEK